MNIMSKIHSIFTNEIKTYYYAVSKIDVALNIKRGNMAMKRENYWRAIHFYKLSLLKEPKNITALYNCGIVFRKLNMYVDARFCFNEILENGDDASALMQLAMIETELENYDKATNLLERALAVSDIYEINYKLGIIKLLINDYNNAVKYLKKAIELNPYNPVLYYYCGIAYDKSGCQRESLIYIKKAKELRAKS